MNPIKSTRLVGPSVKKFEETDDKGVVTSVHGIMKTQFSSFADFYNEAEGRKRSLLRANYKNKNVQIITREIKTITMDMPILGLEHAVVYPRKKPSKLPLKKRVLKKIMYSDQIIPTTVNINKVDEADYAVNQEIQEEKKDTKSVTFLNHELEENVDYQKMINSSKDKVITIKQKVASDTILQQKLKDIVVSNEISQTGDSSKLPKRVNKDESMTQCIVCKQSIIDQSSCQSVKSSIGSKIPKPMRMFKQLQKTKTEEDKKLIDIQTYSKTGQSKTSLTSNAELNSIVSNSKSISKTSHNSASESVSSQIVSKSSQKLASKSKTNQSVPIVSNTSTRSSKSKSNVVDKQVVNTKNAVEKSSRCNKNNTKKSIATPVKSKTATKPIKNIKNILQEIPINKKTPPVSNRSLKKK